MVEPSPSLWEGVEDSPNGLRDFTDHPDLKKADKVPLQLCFFVCSCSGFRYWGRAILSTMSTTSRGIEDAADESSRCNPSGMRSG